MAQYTPTYRAIGQAPWNRAITRAEYDVVCRTVERLGFTEGWIQDFGAAPGGTLAGFNMPPRRKTEFWRGGMTENVKTIDGS